jgi:hypothetical protein
MGFMIHIPPFSRKCRSIIAPSFGRMNVVGMKSYSAGSKPFFAAPFSDRFTFFAMRSFLVNSTWLGKWFTRWCSLRRRPCDPVLAYGTFSWIHPTSA